jgi:hypothetical protein
MLPVWLTAWLTLIGTVDAEEVHEQRPPEEPPASVKPEPPAREQDPLESFLKRGDYTFIPLPAFSYARNEGSWVGALIPVVKENADGHIGTIIAPQYLYNHLVGQTVTGSYLRYPSDTAQYEINGLFSEKIPRDIDFRYQDVGAGGCRFIIGGQVEWLKNPFARFFGFGNHASEQRETNYTSRETKVSLTGGINLTPDLGVLITERYREVEVQNGVVDSLPSTVQFFPRVAGIDGAQILGQRLTLLYDSRDHQRTPVKGSYITASGEYDLNFHSNEPHRWWRYTLDARTLLSHGQGRLIFVPRFLLDGVVGDKGEHHGIPFYERPMLGGENTLRAFGQNRYISNTAILLNLEERILVKERVIFGHAVGLEIAPFVDMGRVARNPPWQKINLQNWQVNPGIGVRMLARPHIVGRADFAYGRDGFNAFVGLDYPF